MAPEPAGIVLAAGAGSRLRPLTDLRPKPLCPVGGLPLVDHALTRLAPLTGDGPAHLAVNAHHHADAIRAHCESRVTVAVETGDEALGTAGGVANLLPWLDGRDALVTNADQYLPGGLAGFTDGWDGERCRLLCRPDPAKNDFGRGLRYVGACLLPWQLIRHLEPEPTGLYEVLWRRELEGGRLDLVVLPESAVAIDCGTPADYLAANLHASGGRSVIGEGAQVLGTVNSSVVWDGAYVAPGEVLERQIRAGSRERSVTVAG
ncbi:NTP transferase domain-containing protein [Kineosporia sp. J2-2]|uniref:NTP transferase domain-containing protein n=1 Tax=Kineosporia corallincola TaxID=2835133 RepID=A0ABS5TA20_9ACTN|nr:NTP transferase domain-containing protein [Kineosporia corallincola]MBT0767914.1 NTP transferase domain-containing protein [Kineosporia corallincola]